VASARADCTVGESAIGDAARGIGNGVAEAAEGGMGATERAAGAPIGTSLVLMSGDGAPLGRVAWPMSSREGTTGRGGCIDGTCGARGAAGGPDARAGGLIGGAIAAWGVEP